MSRLRPLTEPAARHVIENLREWDRLETIAGFGPNFIDQAVECALQQQHRWSYGPKEDRPVAIVGGSCHGNAYIAYMLATNEFPSISPGLTRETLSVIVPTIIAESAASRAECFSLPGHTKAHGWLRKLGAKPVELVTGMGRQNEDLVRWRLEFRDVHVSGRSAR